MVELSASNFWAALAIALVTVGIPLVVAGAVAQVRLWSDMQQVKNDIREFKKERTDIYGVLLEIRERLSRIEGRMTEEDKRR